MVSTDRDALVAFYDANGGKYWKENANWNTDAALAQWHGVRVKDQDRVRELDLSSNNLTGPIPEELGKLTALQKLYLYQNKLSGPIPKELGALSKLQRLWLSGNGLTGHIPPQLGQLGAVRSLHLSGNKLDGHIPAQLGQLGALQYLYLDNNELHGPIPPELGELAALTVLGLAGNQLTGHIPPELGALSELRHLWLNSNKLTGPIPEKLGKLTALQELYLHGNKLSGHIPSELGHLSALTVLRLHGNQLSGPIPPELGGLGKLKALWLQNNELAGAIPAQLGALNKLESLDLSNNQLSGPIPGALGDLNKLKTLSLGVNQFTEIPPEVLELYRERLSEESWSQNAWSRPPLTVLNSGIERALGWWKDVKLFGEGKSNRLKMVLVGLAEAGKTTVVRHFTGGSVPKFPDRTVGIEITDWSPLDEGPLQVSVWDFAGQADYYSSHQLFLTKGSLFMLVVDLYAFSKEVSSAVDDFTDPRGRIYWWLEMLYMRVPGAAIALVGSHVDDMEKEDLDADLAGKRLHHVVNKFIKDKAKNVLKGKSNRCVNTQSTTTTEADHRQDGGEAFAPTQRSGSSRFSAEPLVLHDHVFKVSLDPASVRVLQEWVVKAASGRECPRGFNFPAVDQTVPKAWIEAYAAMDAVTTPCVLWSEAVVKFGNAMSGSLPDADDPGEVLLRAMQHREAEGGALLSLADASAPVANDLLHLDPSWLIELVRRLADHNLVDNDERKQGTIRQQLREYAEEQHVQIDPLRQMHRVYCKSGHLNRDYLRFLWTYRKIKPPGPAVDLTKSKFESIISTMVRLLVMYRARGEGDFVVPARLPEYGHQRVLDPDNIVEIVVVMKCSFGQLYPPPGIVGRFLAWLTPVDEYGECWQHGAFVSYKHHKVFFFESEDKEPHEDGTESKFAGLTLGVQGLRHEARLILDELKGSLKQLVSDSAYGYPGLASLMFFEELVETKSNELLALRSLLDNIGDRLDKVERKLDGVANQLVEGMMLAASANKDGCPYPRMVILVPDAEEFGTQGRIQHVGWDRWTEAWKRLDESVGLHQEFRLRFLCEYNLAEVPCGADGRGYLIKKPKDWVKKCIPLMQASLWVLRVAVGIVSNVDLPLDEVLGAAVKAAGAELVDGIGTEVPSTINTDLSVFGEGVPVAKIQEFKDLQGPAYKSMCEFMREAEAPPSRRWLGCPPCHREPSPPTGCWKDSMVQERNGRGGWAWVLETNQAAYVRDRDAASEGSTRAFSS